MNTPPRTLPITLDNVHDWFPSPWTENPFAGHPWWQMQCIGLMAALQYLRLLPDDLNRQQALVELRRSIDTSLLSIEPPADEEIARRLAQTLAPYCPSHHEVVNAMLDLADLTSADVVMDLGSGDGRIVFAAANRGVKKAIGVEIDHALVMTAREMAEGQTLPVEFVHGDVLTADLSEATVIVCYLLSASMAHLREKFLALRPGTRIISQAFPMPGWPPDAVVNHPHAPIYRWEVPYT